MSPTYSVCSEHGYIAGEVYTCPVCGKSTEVYSRITGYYRPVQNWNDGKRKEFEDRKVYNIDNSKFTEKVVVEDKNECTCAQNDTIATPILFTRNGCPNCKTSKMMLDKAGITYEIVNAEEDKELTLKYGVKKAPTLIVPTADGNVAYDNASEIRKYIESVK
jgi:ribonucleoside-triphosphate reductase